MYIIPLSDIIIPENRQRRTFPATEREELKTSIAHRGLLHPIVIRADKRTLVCGERRLQAITELHQTDVEFTCNGQIIKSGDIPCTLLTDLSPLELEEAELEENILRVDLHFLEKAKAIDRLHKLRTKQAELRGEVQTLQETGNEVGNKNLNAIRESLVLAEHADTIPELAKAATHKEAVKIVKRTLETRARAAKADSMKAIKTPHSIYEGSCRDQLPALPSESFDLLLTDPPYGIGANSFGSQAAVAHNYLDGEVEALSLYEFLAEESYRLCKSEAHAYVFCAPQLYQRISLLFSLAGWAVWPRPLIWSKRNGMLPRPQHGPRYTYEMLLFASKGDKRTLCIKPDVLDFSQVQDQLHGAEKPVDLLRDLISRSCEPGSRILDPFAGSGSTLEAAELSHCIATLVELDKTNFNICLERQANLQLDINV